jgi:hypothetical protein
VTTLVYGGNLLICKGHASSISDTLFDHAWNVMLILAQSVPHRGVAAMAASETMTPRETSAALRRRSPSLLLAFPVKWRNFGR